MSNWTDDMTRRSVVGDLYAVKNQCASLINRMPEGMTRTMVRLAHKLIAAALHREHGGRV